MPRLITTVKGCFAFSTPAGITITVQSRGGYLDRCRVEVEAESEAEATQALCDLIENLYGAFGFTRSAPAADLRAKLDTIESLCKSETDSAFARRILDIIRLPDTLRSGS